MAAMTSISLLDTVVAVVVGSILMFALKKRIESWKTPGSHSAILTNVWIFTAFAVGLTIMRPQAITAFAESAAGAFFSAISVYIGIVLAVVYLDDQRSLEALASAAFRGLFIAIIPSVLVFNLLVPSQEVSAVIPPSSLLSCAIFIAVMGAAGLFHGILGPLVSATNLALTIAMFWEADHLPSAETYFRFLELIGIESPLYGSLVLIVSTLLGLTEYLGNVPGLVRSYFEGDAS